MDSIFTKIINREISTDILYEDEYCIAINDLHPQAPIHILVIPKKPLVNLSDATEDDESLLGRLMLVSAKIAKQNSIAQGFRLVVNNGKGAGQSVFHLHLHIMGKKLMTEKSL